MAKNGTSAITLRKQSDPYMRIFYMTQYVNKITIFSIFHFISYFRMLPTKLNIIFINPQKTNDIKQSA